jgi:uncharacterized protein
MKLMAIRNPRMHATALGHGALILALLCLLAASVSAQELPTDRLLRSLRPSADVNDYAGILTPAQRQALEQRCRKLRETRGAELAVVLLDSLEGGQVDDFAVKLFKQWGIGQKGENNGVLLLVAIQDRKARIEVGYGLEPILPDALAGRILNEQLFPAFKQKKYAEGLQATVERLASIIEKKEPPPANLRQADAPFSGFAIVVVLSLFVAVGSFAVGVSLNQPPGCLVPPIFVLIPFLIGCAIAFPWAPLVHVPLGLLMAWLGWRVRQDRHRPRRRSSGNWTGTSPDWNAWSWGNAASDWSGGGFSGGGSGWGGFSGGSSGGGGASGSW